MALHYDGLMSPFLVELTLNYCSMLFDPSHPRRRRFPSWCGSKWNSIKSARPGPSIETGSKRLAQCSWTNLERPRNFLWRSVNVPTFQCLETISAHWQKQTLPSRREIWSMWWRPPRQQRRLKPQHEILKPSLWRYWHSTNHSDNSNVDRDIGFSNNFNGALSTVDDNIEKNDVENEFTDEKTIKYTITAISSLTTWKSNDYSGWEAN